MHQNSREKTLLVIDTIFLLIPLVLKFIQKCERWDWRNGGNSLGKKDNDDAKTAWAWGTIDHSEIGRAGIVDLKYEGKRNSSRKKQASKRFKKIVNTLRKDKKIEFT